MTNLIQPKPYLEKIKLRHKATGVERRRNMSKIVLEKGTPFPKPKIGRASCRERV